MAPLEVASEEHGAVGGGLVVVHLRGDGGSLGHLGQALGVVAGLVLLAVALADLAVLPDGGPQLLRVEEQLVVSEELGADGGELVVVHLRGLVDGVVDGVDGVL